MGAFSIWHILLVLVVILLVFGAGKLPRLMGDFAKGIKSFKQGMKDPLETERSDSAKPAGHIADAAPAGAGTTTSDSAKSDGERA